MIFNGIASKFSLFFPEKADNLHKISKPIFRENKKKKIASIVSRFWKISENKTETISINRDFDKNVQMPELIRIFLGAHVRRYNFGIVQMHYLPLLYESINFFIPKLMCIVLVPQLNLY